jgi:hypothetical protein
MSSNNKNKTNKPKKRFENKLHSFFSTFEISFTNGVGIFALTEALMMFFTVQTECARKNSHFLKDDVSMA